MRLTKEEFVHELNGVKKAWDTANSIADVIGVFDCAGPLYDAANELFDFLVKMCDLRDEKYEFEYGCVLDFLCFNLDFGRANNFTKVPDGYPRGINYSNYEDLYDAIVNEYFNKE